MVNPKYDDRLNYSNLLRPKAGFELEQAICTTFSLDIENLITVIIALGFSVDTPQEKLQNKALMLKSIADLSSKLVIYYDSSQIITHKLNKDVYALLEKMLVPVNLPMIDNTKYYPSFHNKTWMLTYKKTDGDEKYYRFLNLSRNLTSDKSWDVCFSMDGKTVNYVVNSNLPDYYLQLSTLLGEDYKKDHLKLLSETLKTVKFSLDESDDFFNEIPQVIPLGFNDNKYISNETIFNNSEQSKYKYNRLLIMSPFIKISFLRDVVKHKSKDIDEKDILITRLDRLQSIININDINFLKKNFRVYVIKDSSNDDESIGNDIHAKMFLIENRNENCDLYAGSMNATAAARNYNYEMMLKFSFYKEKINYDHFVGDLINPDEKKTYFRLINDELTTGTPDEDEKLDKENNDIIKTICRLGLYADVVEVEEKYRITVRNAYDEKQQLLRIDFNKIKVTISPVTIDNKVELKIYDNTVEPFSYEVDDIQKISSFYEVIISGEKEYKSTIIIPTNNIPPERDIQIKRKMLENDSDVLDYIKLLLASDSSDIGNEILNRSENSSSSYSNDSDEIGIYESLLKKFAREPRVLKDFVFMVDNLPKKSKYYSSLTNLKKIFLEACSECGVKYEFE